MATVLMYDAGPLNDELNAIMEKRGVAHLKGAFKRELWSGLIASTQSSFGQVSGMPQGLSANARKYFLDTRKRAVQASIKNLRANLDPKETWKIKFFDDPNMPLWNSPRMKPKLPVIYGALSFADQLKKYGPTALAGMVAVVAAPFAIAAIGTAAAAGSITATSVISVGTGAAWSKVRPASAASSAWTFRKFRFQRAFATLRAA